MQSKGLSRVFSNTTVQKYQFFGAQPSSQFNSHIEKDKTGRITVADIGELFEGQKSEIEDLFSEEDFKRFCLSKEVKKFDEAFCVGYSIVNDYESLSDETKENFEKVIEYIATI